MGLARILSIPPTLLWLSVLTFGEVLLPHRCRNCTPLKLMQAPRLYDEKSDIIHRRSESQSPCSEQCVFVFLDDEAAYLYELSSLSNHTEICCEAKHRNLISGGIFMASVPNNGAVCSGKSVHVYAEDVDKSHTFYSTLLLQGCTN